MEVAPVSAALGVLFPRLVSEAEKQIKLFRHYKKDMEKLKSSITTVQSFLNDAEKKQVTRGTVKLWLQKLEGVAFDADSVLDEFDYQHLSKQVRARHKVKEKMGNASRSLKLMKKVRLFFSRNSRRLKMAHKIKDINKNLDEINKEASAYGLQISVAGASHAPSDGSAAGTSAGKETTSKDKDPVFIGRENDVSEIVKMMTTPPKGDQTVKMMTTPPKGDQIVETMTPPPKGDPVLSILAIVGMGGIGKTTVAQHVLDHDNIKTHFDKLFWVHVSENFDASILSSKILASLLKETANVDHVSRQNVLEKLENTLGANRFLLVLDDVWNKDRKIWGSFINSLRNICCATGNGIIVTTRSEDVASVVTRHPMHILKNLSNDECWSIIKKKAFPDRSIPSYFQTTGVSIAKGCQGLPLAANVVGGLLEGQPIDKWRSIEKDCLSNFSNLGDEYSVSNILKSSYNHLSSQSLKKCFAYCSIFPKGFSLKREQLVEMWMAEGFLAGNDDMEKMGNEFFDLLLHNSLLQVVERNIVFGSKYYSMHDLVHDLAFSVLNSSHQVRYLRLQPTGAEPSGIPKEQARCIRSLLLIDKICAGMPSEFKSLHVLILMTRGGEELPSSIGELIHLRCIDISRTTMKCLPDSVGQLYHLQTLRACDNLRKLPDTLKHLIGLRHLHIPRIQLPPEMGRLTSLRTLRQFGVGDENGRGIAELGSLKNLEGELEIYNLENVHDKEEAKRADLLQKPNIFKLTLKWGQNREGENNDEDVLGGLQPHPNLRHLEICRFRGRSFSSWSSTMIDLDKLTTIRLASCEECEQIPTLGHLPHLENLYLLDLPNVKSIESSFYGTDDRCVSENPLTNVFPALERLELDMKNLAEWKEAELPNATMNGRLVFPCLQELKIVDVLGELPWTSICGINLKYPLKKLYICYVELLIRLPDWLFSNNQNLSQLTIASCDNLTRLVPSFRNGGTSHVRELYIYGCPKLRELPNDLCSLNALETLRISSCLILERIPYPDDEQLLGLSLLRVLKIHNCKGLTNVASKMIESCAPSLETLSLTKLTSLENMEDVIGCFEKMSRLSKLKILDVPITTNPIGPYLGNLTKLSMSTCDEYSSSVVDSILEGSISSLRRLELRGKDDRDLPDQLQHLTALSELTLNGFPKIVALPEWFGDSKFSSSLQKLYLVKCKNLRHLPSKEAMLRLTKLSFLKTSLCPLLKLNKRLERNSNGDHDFEWHHISYISIDDDAAAAAAADDDDDDDSEWPKISHIRHVIVDSQDLGTHYQ